MEYHRGHGLKKGDKLINLFNNQIIAVSVNSIPFESTAPSTHGDGYIMEIYGYVFKSSIKTSSIPENNLNAMLKSVKKLNPNLLHDFMLKEGYKNQHIINKILPGFNEYCIYESTVIDLSPGYRIGLIFEHNNLVAVEHSRPIDIGNYKEYSFFEDNKVLIIKSPQSISVNMFVKKMNQVFQGAD